jgi:hypothetical protein
MSDVLEYPEPPTPETPANSPLTPASTHNMRAIEINDETYSVVIACLPIAFEQLEKSYVNGHILVINDVPPGQMTRCNTWWPIDRFFEVFEIIEEGPSNTFIPVRRKA